MPAPWRRGEQARAAYVVVERNAVVDGAGQHVGLEARNPTPTQGRTLRRSHARRQMMPQPTDDDYESDDDYDDITSARPTPIGPPASRITPAPTNAALADNAPSPTVVVSSGRPLSDSGGISQNTEHLLIAAGSIGATIILVMLILGLYTMRKRGLSFADVIDQGKETVRRRRGLGPTPPPKYEGDKKIAYDDEWVYAGKDSYPQRAASSSRSGSLSTQTPLKPLAHSDSFKHPTLARNDSMNRSFLLDSAPTRQPSHRRDISATPSSPVLPIQDTPRRSASTHNTRSITEDDFPAPPPHQSALPPPPSFRQFLSNRPSISQRPGHGGPIASRFSWTNSNAPQTPHDPSRDTAASQPAAAGRDSFVTTRSSVPRFRTIDSWVNQQSTRVEEQRLKQQFRMTSSTTYSEDDSVPEMPEVPKKHLSGGGLKGKNIKHVRLDSVDTAPIFKAHPGTEVRFSTRSTVPSEVLDMGRRNVAL